MDTKRIGRASCILFGMTVHFFGRVACFCLLASTVLYPSLAFADSGGPEPVQGDLDDSFHPPDGYALYSDWNRDSYVGVAIQSDGKILVSSGINGPADTDAVLLRYTPSGALDKGFGDEGVALYDGGIGDDCGRLVALQSDGKILVTGYTDNGLDQDVLTLRYQSNGTLDPGFGTNGIVTYDSMGRTDRGRSIAVQPDGKIVVLVWSSDGTVRRILLLRYDSAGTLDPTFGTGGIAVYESDYGNDGGRDLVLQKDGKIVVAGYHFNGTDFDIATLRFNSDGSLDPSFGVNGAVFYDGGYGDDGARGVGVQSDGKIVVSGGTSNGTDYDVRVLRYDRHGALDGDFGTGGVVVYDGQHGDDQGRRLAIQPDGRIVVAGFSSNGEDYDAMVLRLNWDGSLDDTFGKGGAAIFDGNQGNDYAEGIVVQPDGRVVAAGGSFQDGGYDIITLRLLATLAAPKLCATIQNGWVLLSWSGTPAASGYSLFMGFEPEFTSMSGLDMGHQTSYACYWPVSGIPVYFAVRANYGTVYSGYSNIVDSTN